MQHKLLVSMGIVALSAGLLTLGSCSQDQDLIQGESRENASLVSILSFSSREQLELAIRSGNNRDSYGRSLAASADDAQTQEARSVSKDSTLQIPFSVLVPDASFRKLLNKQGEIQVGDSVYRITPEGTFYAHHRDLDELRQLSQSPLPREAQQVDEERYRYGNVTLLRTFAGVTFTEDDVEEQGEGDNEATPKQQARAIPFAPSFAGGVPVPDLNTFPSERAQRKTILGKVFYGLSVPYSHTSTLPSNKKRRLNCAVYNYDYAIYHSIGVRAKIQKKMWYGGWGVVKNWGANTIMVGFRHVLMRYPYPPDMKARVQEMMRPIEASQQSAIIAARKDRFLTGIPYPDWFKRSVFPVSLPLLGTTLSSITYQDVASLAKDKIHGFIKSRLSARNPEVYNPTDFFAPRLSDQEVEETINKYKLMDFAPSAIPIYAKDHIYMLYTGGWVMNREDQPEIDFKLDAGFGQGQIGISWNPNSPFKISSPSFSPNIGFNPKNPGATSLNGGSLSAGALKLEFSSADNKAELIEGSFFALAYSDGWVGYNLYW